MPSDDLVETLRDAQRFGFFGPGPIEAAIEHAGAFVAALGGTPVPKRIVDLGSGGGLPGLVIAEAFPDSTVTLIDRREKRTDFLRRAVGRLGWSHVEVMTRDVADLASAVERGERASFDAVTARGFGPPAVTVSFGSRLLAADGRIVISEPPTDVERWDQELLGRLGLIDHRVGPVRVFQAAGDSGDAVEQARGQADRRPQGR